MYKATTIAEWFVDKFIDDNSPITQIKLTKILYLTQGFYLAKYKKPLFKDAIFAYNFGPVLPMVNHRYVCCSSNYIYTKEYHTYDERLDTETIEFLQFMYDARSKL